MLEIGIWQDVYVFKVPSCILYRKHPQMLDSFPLIYPEWKWLGGWYDTVCLQDWGTHPMRLRSFDIRVTIYTFAYILFYNYIQHRMSMYIYLLICILCIYIDVLELPNIACWLCYFCSIQLQVICHHWTYTSMSLSHKMRGNREELDGHLSTLSHHRSSAGFV